MIKAKLSNPAPRLPIGLDNWSAREKTASAIENLNGAVGASIIPAVNTLQSNVASIQSQLSSGISAVIVTAKLTSGGTEGSMKFVDGILVAQTPAT